MKNDRAPELPSERINVIFMKLLEKAAQDAKCPMEVLPIHVMLAARLEAHERYLDLVEQPPNIVSLQ